VLGAKVSYDTERKVPILNSKAVTNFKVIGKTTYFKLADLKTLVGATLSWDQKHKTLFITTKTES